MKLIKVHIHNFRSIEDAEFDLDDYSMLVGENNAGKTNILTALRIFYDDTKFNKAIDLPKIKDAPIESDDYESWIELSFETTQEEQDTLSDEYKSDSLILKVRKILYSNKIKITLTNSHIYAYIGDELSGDQFYGTKNVSQNKLGKIIFIPPISKSEDVLKTTGSSPFRDMVNHIMKQAVIESTSYGNLQSAFGKFNENFQGEISKDGLSIDSLIDNINSDIMNWGVECGISINQIKPEEIVKTLLDFDLKDKRLDGEKIEVSSFGQGLQRHLIFTLIKLASKFGSKKLATKKEKVFDPDFTLILYEEPEAFLHPSQQRILYLNLNKLATHETSQVLVSSHSPHFVSKQIEKILGIIKLTKNELGVSTIFQISKTSYEKIVEKNQKNNKGSTDEEFLWYSVWLDSERSSMFFAKQVIICEGPTERIFLDHLCDTKESWESIRNKHVYFLDVMGKYNIHRYIHLLGELGIQHSVLYDKDRGVDDHPEINKHILSIKNKFTHQYHGFDKDFEFFLGIEPTKRKYKKPLHLVARYKEKMICDNKIDELREVIDNLIA